MLNENFSCPEIRFTVDKNFFLCDITSVPCQGQGQLFNWRQVLGLEQGCHDDLVELGRLVAVVRATKNCQLKKKLK